MLLAIYLELVLGLRAICRAESFATIGNSGIDWHGQGLEHDST
jgi:hypothetical protein